MIFLSKENGARHSIVEEHLGWAKEYPIRWREPRVNLAELAKLRWIEGWSRKQLADRYGKTIVAIQNYFQDIKRQDFKIGLTPEEMEQIKWASTKSS